MSPEQESSRPLLTAAIAAGDLQSLEELSEQLSGAGLLHQPDVQIIVAHTGRHDLVCDAANVRIVSCPPGTPFFRLYATVLEQSDSEYVALLDAGCPPGQGWLAAAREQFHAATAIFYGPVECAWESGDPGMIGYLIEYAQFRRPLDPQLGEYPGNNIVFRRVLAENAVTEEGGFQKTFFLRRVEKVQGIQPRACDDMTVVYRKSYPWSCYLRRRMRHGRLYGSGHALSLGKRRFLYAGGTIVLPLLRYWRILRAARRPPRLVREVVRFSVPIFISECAWSAGECLGYLAGAASDEACLD